MTYQELDCIKAALDIHECLFRYGRISVRQSKEKYGTVRVYCSLGYYGFYDMLYPGRVWVHWPRWLHGLDLKYGSAVMRVLNKIIVPYHKFVYRRAYKKAIEKYPAIRENILRTADFPYLLDEI